MLGLKSEISTCVLYSKSKNSSVMASNSYSPTPAPAWTYSQPPRRGHPVPPVPGKKSGEISQHRAASPEIITLKPASSQASIDKKPLEHVLEDSADDPEVQTSEKEQLAQATEELFAPQIGAMSMPAAGTQQQQPLPVLVPVIYGAEHGYRSVNGNFTDQQYGSSTEQPYENGPSIFEVTKKDVASFKPIPSSQHAAYELFALLDTDRRNNFDCFTPSTAELLKKFIVVFCFISICLCLWPFTCICLCVALRTSIKVKR